MFRRRRRTREIEFSFDSFLDVVANVCGVIIRLILVTWAGARAYHAAMAEQAFSPLSSPLAAAVAALPKTPPELPPIADPLEHEVLLRRAELANQEQRLLEQLRQFDWLKDSNAQADRQVQSVSAADLETHKDQTLLEKKAAQNAADAQATEMSLADFERRSKALAAQLSELEKQPPPPKILRYLTPLSRPVHTSQLDFECFGNRVAFIDVEAFAREAQRTMEDKRVLSQGEVEGVTEPVAGFRMHYTMERAAIPQVGLMGLPVQEKGSRYRLTEWIVEPVVRERGEAGERALAAGSEFHRQVDAMDPERTVITFWVYPDSFALYRKLRDYLHEKGVEVAGRPLLPGTPIAGSTRRGTVSRGQ